MLGGLTMSHIMYTTEVLNGTIWSASAYVVWLYEAYLAEGRPAADVGGDTRMSLVAFAHGTNGSFRKCSPSNYSYESLLYRFQVPRALELQGFAVVATDYRGLGVAEFPDDRTIEHSYLAAPSHANDIAYSIITVRAASKRVFKSDGPFAVMGHSQEGTAA